MALSENQQKEEVIAAAARGVGSAGEPAPADAP